MNGFDLSTITNAYVGSTQVSAIYLGSNKLWPNTHDYSSDYLTIHLYSDSYIYFQRTIPEGTTPGTGNLSYSNDGGTTWTQLSWMTITSNHEMVKTPKLNAGDNVLFKGNLTPCYQGIGGFTVLDSTINQYYVEGNIMSLLYGDNFVGETDISDYSYCFGQLFSGNLITNARNLILPATTLSNNCYTGMFLDNTSLLEGPTLPATTLASNCYNSMFSGCTSLTTAPELPATTLAYNCYYGMFSGCTSLNYIKMLATDISASDCLTNWVINVAETGTFVKAASMTSLPTGINGIPTGWVVQSDTSLPADCIFNYHYKNYDSTTNSIINDSNASLPENLLFKGSSTPTVSADYMTVPNYVYAEVCNYNDVYFNKTASNKNMTVIIKITTPSAGDGDIISNRTNWNNYNWMCRWQLAGKKIYLHGAENYSSTAPVITTSPNILSYKVDDDYKAHTKAWYDNTEFVCDFTYHEYNYLNTKLTFFNGYQDGWYAAYYNGNFYWAAYYDRTLTDAEIQQVIDYNESL